MAVTKYILTPAIGECQFTPIKWSNAEIVKLALERIHPETSSKELAVKDIKASFAMTVKWAIQKSVTIKSVLFVPMIPSILWE